MDLTAILASLLNPNGQQSILGPAQAIGGPGPVGDHNDPRILQAQMARAPMQQPQMAPQPYQQPQAPPQAVPQPAMPQSAPQAPQQASAPQGGGLGGFLEGLIAPNRSARSKTASWLKTQGMDDVTATAVAADPQLLRSVMMQRAQGKNISEFDQRAQAAQEYGMQEGTPEFKNFVLTGSLPKADSDRLQAVGKDSALYDPVSRTWITPPNGGTRDATAAQQDYEYAMKQLRERGVPEDKLPTFQEFSKPKSRGISFRGADGTEIQIGGEGDGTAYGGTSLPAEVGGRIGLGDNFIKNDYPEVLKMIENGDATGPIDYAAGVLGRGNSGIVQRRMASGADALRRGLTGAGMSASESEEYSKRYLPQPTDDVATLKLKAEGLKADLEAVTSGAIKGKAGDVGGFLSPGGGQSPPAAEAPPPSYTGKNWQYLTPEQRKLWQ